ncbi:DUF1926 domain-containing protein, partial [bacterium]|nr:DUF1926 domain-containing protein [bacterium]
LSSIPAADRIDQIKALTKLVDKEFHCQPVGLWLPERIWEPTLPKTLREAGISYTLVDDAHFKNAGLFEEDLFGYYLTEEEGETLALFSGSEKLRYLIPFADNVYKPIEYFESISDQDEERLIILGDDGEKFGNWPGTYDWVYEKGWIDSFFTQLEENSHWISTTTFSDWMKNHKPLGRIYLPTASYSEMMTWALPTKSIHLYEELVDKIKGEGTFSKYEPFLKGGFYRNFLIKYPEANIMHKKMLYVSSKVNRIKNKKLKEKGKVELFKGQCNCAYWHGVFGGLYLPHLRTAIFEHLIKAEEIADSELKKSSRIEVEAIDFDKNGALEVLVNASYLNLYFSPSYGGALFELDLKEKSRNLLDTLSRREEGYHKDLLKLVLDSDRGKAGSSKEEATAKSIHTIVTSKEENLASYLNYDWYRRLSLLDHFLGDDTTLDGFAKSKYREQGDFVNQPYEYKIYRRGDKAGVILWRDGGVWINEEFVPLQCEKKVYLSTQERGFKAEYRITNLSSKNIDLHFGIEFNLALNKEVQIESKTLADSGQYKSLKEILLMDNALGTKVNFKFDKNTNLWHFPIQTISQSEAGFEKNYQQACLLFNWKLSLSAKVSWKTKIATSFI